MKNKHLVCYPSSKFTWTGRTGVAEASDFGPIGTEIWRAIYDDACDVGFDVLSKRSGSTVTFVLAGELRDERENELIGWKLVSIDPLTHEQRAAMVPMSGKYQIHILND